MTQSIFSLKIKEIADLSNKYPLWKIHWLGELGINGVTNEPIIDLCLVPYKSSTLYNPKFLSVIENNEYDFGEMRTVSIGVGQLPIVSIGSLFKDGTPFGRPAYVTRTFKFTPTITNQKVINLGSSWQNENGKTRFYIPTNQFRVLRSPGFRYVSDNTNKTSTHFPFVLSGNTEESAAQKNPENILKGKCVLIDFNTKERKRIPDSQYPFSEKVWRQEIVGLTAEVKNGYDGIIVPCIELIRFYYANSSQMFLQIFTDGLLGDDNRVFKSSRMIMPDLKGENGFVYLSKWIKNIDLPIIARLAFDKYALKQARKIYYSLVAADKIKDGKVPETLFPFIDQQTNLKVHGTPLQSGEKRYFLVNWIESCTAAFPFTDLKFWRENPGQMVKDYLGKDFNEKTSNFIYSDDYSPIQNEATKCHQKYQSNSLELVTNVPPSVARDELEILLPLNKFPDLQNKMWQPENPNPNFAENSAKDDRPRNNINLLDIPVPIEIGSTAGRSGIKKVTKATIGTIKQDSTKEILNFEDNIKYKRTILFKGIADAINLNLNNEFTAELLYLLSESREIHYGDKPSKFPTIDFNKIRVNKSEVKKLAGQDIYIMEVIFIKGDRNFYAYFLDIIPEAAADKNSHCFCLVFTKSVLSALSGIKINNLLTECLKNNGTWFTVKYQIPDSENRGKFKDVWNRKMHRTINNLMMIKINHRDLPSDYFAKVIVERLKQEIEIILNY